MWKWIIGIGALVFGYKVMSYRTELTNRAISTLKVRIPFLRDKARKGDKDALAKLRGLDSICQDLEKRPDDPTSAKILTALKYEGLYPPSSL